MQCKKCGIEKPIEEFYANDKSCKCCRRAMVKANREANADYYRDYDKKRFKSDPRVSERHKKYQQTEAGKAASERAKKKWKEQNPVKRAVHVITGNAIRNGALIKSGCEVCGTLSNVHAHHDDYGKPLEVRWLCAAHHKQWHEENGEALNA